MPAFQWRIPELERQSGVNIEESDGYAGALLRIKIKARGEQLDDYMAGDWWNEGKRDALARQVGLIDAIDERLHLLRFHFPYHESDHVLAQASLPLCGGTCLQDLELLRNDEVFLNAINAEERPAEPGASRSTRSQMPPTQLFLTDSM